MPPLRVSSRCRLPVTLRAAPWKWSFIVEIIGLEVYL
jgi:hypothetical protein